MTRKRRSATVIDEIVVEQPTTEQLERMATLTIDPPKPDLDHNSSCKHCGGVPIVRFTGCCEKCNKALM